MKRYPTEVGCVVISLAGRDEGRRYIVIREIDENFVEVANGKLRGIDRLKKKRRKHLKPTGERVEALIEKLKNGETVENHEIRSWLKREEENLVEV